MKLVSTMVLALLCAGFVCPPQDQGASELSPASFVAPRDKALVVFVRPKKYGKVTKFYVFDENRKLLTLLKGNEHVTIEVAPGKHTFYIGSWRAALVRAELAAGRTYVVQLKLSPWSGEVSHTPCCETRRTLPSPLNGFATPDEASRIFPKRTGG